MHDLNYVQDPPGPNDTPPREVLVTSPDPDGEPVLLQLTPLSDGAFAFSGDIRWTPDELLAIGTALKRWQTEWLEERHVTAMEHAEACRGEVTLAFTTNESGE